MTITINPIDVSSHTWGDVINRVNQLITFASNNAVTAGGDDTVGNVVIAGNISANVANLITVVASHVASNTAMFTTLTANTANVGILNVTSIPTFSSNTFTANTATITNLRSPSANLTNIVSTNITSTNGTFTTKLGAKTTELRYLVTFGQPGVAEGTTFNDRMVGISGAGGAGYKLDDTTNNIRATFGTFGTNDVQIKTTTNHAIVAVAANTAVARFATNGNFALGSVVSTAAPLTTLQVGGKVSIGDALTAAKLTSGTSYTNDLNLIGSDAGIRMWRWMSPTNGEVTVEYALGADANIANDERWQTGINNLGYFVQNLTGNANTYAMLVGKAGSVSIGKGNVVAVGSSILELSSTNKGFLPPRMTTAQRNAIASPAEGLVVYDTNVKQLHFRNASAWENVGGGSVRSVGLTMPTGFTVGSSPVTNTGVIAVSYSSGYTGFTTALQTKLNGIEAGAQVNTVTSVAGRTGAVTLTKADVGLSNVDNTADAAKPISTATQTALNAKANTSMLGALATKNKITVADVDAQGTPSSLTYYRGDGRWSTVDLSGLGDMYQAVYDPTLQEKDAFNRANHTGFMPLAGLDQGTGGAFVVGRTASSGVVTRIGISYAATPTTVALRDNQGKLTVADPTDDVHAATKLYVDNGLTSAIAIVTTNADNRWTDTTGVKGSISGGQDLNNYLDHGIYRVPATASAASGTNFPIALAGTLNVVQGGAGVTQTYTSYAMPGSTPIRFIRGRYTSSSAWTTWRRFAFMEDISAAGLSGDYNDLTGRPVLGNSSSRNVGTTAGTVASGDDARIVAAVPNTRTVTAGTGLTGGGALSGNVTLNVAYGTTAGTAAQGNDTRIVNAVPNARGVLAGTGLTGGGTLDVTRTLSVNFGTTAGTVAAGNDTRITTAVPNTRTVIAGTGLTGGGALSGNVTLNVAYGTTAGTAVQGNDPRVVYSIPNAISTQDTIDWNDITNVGWFNRLVRTGSGTTNGPPQSGTHYYYVQNLIYGGQSITQVAYPYTVDSAGAHIYMRNRYQGTWSAWKMLPNSDMVNSSINTAVSGINASVDNKIAVAVTGVNANTDAKIDVINIDLANKVSVYTGNNVDETNFPIGHIVAVASGTGVVDRNRNQTATIQLAPQPQLYTTSSGTATLAGTWRARGYSGDSNYYIYQRVA